VHSRDPYGSVVRQQRPLSVSDVCRFSRFIKLVQWWFLCLICSPACRASTDTLCLVYLPLGLSIYVVQHLAMLSYTREEIPACRPGALSSAEPDPRLSACEILCSRLAKCTTKKKEDESKLLLANVQSLKSKGEVVMVIAEQ
jgi:hypothetical protein